MKMVDKIEMSLDDIIKQTRGNRTRGGGGGRRGRGIGNSPRRGTRRTQRIGGGVMRGRNRGGITRNSLPYTRVSAYYISIKSFKSEPFLFSGITFVTRAHIHIYVLHFACVWMCVFTHVHVTPYLYCVL